MRQIRDRTLQEETVVLDGHRFSNCHLVDCEIRYSGGAFVLEGTSLTGCTFTFGGAAQRTLTMMRTLKLPFGDEFLDQQADVWSLSTPIN